MDDEKKVAETLLGLGVLGALIYGLTRPKKEEVVSPSPGEGAASISISVLDAQGNPVPHNSPTNLYEGETYTVKVSVTNKSTKAAAPYAATLTITNQSTVDGIGVTSSAPRSDNYSADQTLNFNYTMAVPTGTAGAFGTLHFYVKDPSGNQLAAAYEDISIVAHELVAAIGPGVIFNSDLGSWVDITSGMTITYGLDNTISPEWINYSDIPIAGHVTLKVTYPNGTSVNLTATKNQDAVADPMNGKMVQFAPFNTNQEGTYHLHAEVSSGGKLLNSVDFTLVVVAAIIYGATITITT